VIEKFLKQASREYSPEKRIVALFIEGIVFLGVLPAALVYFSPLLDRQFKLPSLEFGAINIVLGCIFLVAGISLGWWAVYMQFTLGRGTPVPILATQKLIVEKPYRYCRNPMALGAIVAFTGLGILIGSISAVGIVLALAVLLLAYIKIFEEKEMELRFGEAYRAYRKQTPFIVPRLRQ
jgi:protein-S-isoprenylcysteine O-methyltransferase Ste14